MSDKDILKDLFSEKLGNYEAKVKPELWSSISSKIATTAVTGTTTGMSVLAKIIIGSSIAAASVAGGYFIYSASEKESLKAEKTPLSIHEGDQSALTDKNNPIEKTENRTGNPQPVISQQNNNAINENGVSENINNIVQKEDIVYKITEPVIQPENKKTEKEQMDKVPEVVKTPVQEKKKETALPQKQVSPQEQEVIEVLSDKDLPNVFTPNNDGVNDEFMIQSKGLKDFSIVVMDSKNQIVYRSNDTDFRWNGINMNGEPVEEGTYLYYLTAYDSNGKLVSKYKSLKIVK